MKKTDQSLGVKAKDETETLFDAASHQNAASQLDVRASIRRGLAQARKGEGRPANEVFDEMEREDAGSVRRANRESSS
jgi:hypothetical protein